MREPQDVRSEAGSIPALDGLRGVALLWVVLFHVHVLRIAGDPWMALADRARWAGALLGSGYLGVDLFFLLSGFLLALPWLARGLRGAPAPSAREFYIRRVRRIVPAYYVQLALLFAVVLPLLRGWDYWRSDLYVYLYNLAAHAAFLHNTTPLSSGSMGVNGALWTLAVEAQFYLLLPLVAPLASRRPYLSLAAALAIAIAWRFAAPDGLESLVAMEAAFGKHWGWSEESIRSMLLHQLPAYGAHFVLGMVLARAWLARRAAARAAPRGLDVALFAALGVLGAAIAVDDRLARSFTWGMPLLALAFALWWAAHSPRALALLGAGPLAFTGRVSYSAYLVHLPLLLVWKRDMQWLPPWASLPLYLAALFALAWLSWRFVERPFLARSYAAREREPTPSAVPIASTCSSATPQRTWVYRPESINGPNASGASASPASIPE
ncbi:MAG: acyltransferase family protein [Usitatibacter sp.]